MKAQLPYPALFRAKQFLDTAHTYVEEALADIAIADRAHPEKGNSFSKLRVKIHRTKLRLKALARHADTLSKTTEL